MRATSPRWLAPITNRSLTFWDLYTSVDTDCFTRKSSGSHKNISKPLQDLPVRCDKAMCDEVCPQGECNGDQFYCDVFGCKTSGCNCTVSDFTLTTIDDSVLVTTYRKDRCDIRTLPPDPPCRLDISKDIKAICDDDQKVQLIVGSHETIMDTTTMGTSSVAVFPIPPINLPTTVVLNTLNPNGTIYQDSSLIYPDYTVMKHCSVSCWMCYEAKTRWSCMSDFDKFMSVMLAILLLTLMAGSIGWLLMIFFYSLGFCGWTGNKMWGCCKAGVMASRRSIRFARRQYSTMRDETDKDLDNQDIQDEEMPIIETRKRKITSSGSKRVSSAAILAAVAASRARGADAQSFSCVNGAVVESMVATCQSYATNETCLETGSVIFTIPATGASSCLTWNNSNSEPLETTKVEYTGLQYSSTLGSEYFTCAWTGESFSSKSCWTTTNWCGGACDHMNSSDPFGGGHISGVTTTLPGYTGCYRSCGCAGCGCFYCTSACVAYRWGAKPNGEVCEVLDHSVGEFSPIVSIQTSTSNTTHIVKSSLQELDPNFKFTVASATWPAEPTYGPYKVLRCPSGVYFALAAPANQMQPNVIGDIQGPTAAAFTSPSAFSFNVPTTLAVPQFHQSSVTHQFAASGLATATRFKLPYVINGRMWFYEDGKVKTNITSPFGLIMTAEADGVVVSKTYDVVCPVASYTNRASGCYDCFNNASTATIRLKSTCKTGPCQVLVEDGRINVISTVIQANVEERDVAIAFTSSVADVDTTFTISCSGGSAPVRINVTLLPYNLWQQQANGSNGNSTIVVESGGLSFGDFAFGNPLRQFVSSLVIIAIVLFAAAIAYVFWRVLPQCRGSKNTNVSLMELMRMSKSTHTA